ncbi:dual specificity protein phosphatase 10-like [Antedon mediterranea]|uniref:dual specificity protein phosphatase 10-like n=1 Tax=Antedon mediterranea TaxID=105859 RepID=UPI003AF8F8E8
MPPFGTDILEEKSEMESVSLRSSKCCAASSPKTTRLIARSCTPVAAPRPKSTPASPKHACSRSFCNTSCLSNSPVFRHRQKEVKPINVIPNIVGTRPRPMTCVRHRPIQPCELFQKLTEWPNTIIIDSRPFTEFTKRHIQGAFNVLMNPMRRRRLLDGKMTVADMISCEKGRLQLKNRAVHEVVLYDEDSDTLENAPANSAVKCLVTSLEKEGSLSVFLLKGGMKEFETQYRDLCNIENEGKSNNCENPDSPVNTPLLEQIESCFLRATKEGPGQPSPILPCIYIGGDKEAADLDALRKTNISYVLNMTTKLPNYHEKASDITYLRIPVRDNSFEDISRYFEQAFNFIDLALKNNCGILIHCQAGISRSPTVTIAYIMKKNPHMTMSQAYTLVKNRRSVISPNLHFVGQLATFENKLKSSRSSEQKRCPLVSSRSSTPVESAV